MVASGLGVTVLPATALTPRYASPLLKAIEFAIRGLQLPIKPL